jgi:hypothetical protein
VGSTCRRSWTNRARLFSDSAKQALADGDRILGALRGKEVQTLAPPPPVPAAWRDPADTGEPAPVHERPALANISRLSRRSRVVDHA